MLVISNVNRRHSLGLTLIELLAAIAVVAILASVAVPAMGAMLARWQRDSATQAVVSHLQLARSAAIKSSRRVVMCNSQDGMQCADASHKEWTGGWIVFQDDNANNLLDGNETPIAVAGPTAGIKSLKSSNKVRYFAFTSSGLMASGMSSLVVTPQLGNEMSIIVSRVGRYRLSEKLSLKPGK